MPSAICFWRKFPHDPAIRWEDRVRGYPEHDVPLAEQGFRRSVTVHPLLQKRSPVCRHDSYDIWYGLYWGFYCISTKDGSTQWTYEDPAHPGGYYGSGAISRGGRLYFTGDNGILVSHSLTKDTVYDTVPLTTKTASVPVSPMTPAPHPCIRRIPKEPYTGSRYPAMALSRKNIRVSSAAPAARTVHCTSTPAVCHGRLYIGCIADGYGCLSVLDARDLRLYYKAKGAKGAEIKSSPLLSTGYASAKNNNRIYVYVSANHPPGGIYYLADESTSVRGTLQTLYTPAKAKQYCMSSITADREGICTTPTTAIPFLP